MGGRRVNGVKIDLQHSLDSAPQYPLGLAAVRTVHQREAVPIHRRILGRVVLQQGLVVHLRELVRRHLPIITEGSDAARRPLVRKGDIGTTLNGQVNLGVTADPGDQVNLLFNDRAGSGGHEVGRRAGIGVGI